MSISQHNTTMITKTINENLTAVSPEDSDDLLNIRRVIVPGDTIIGDTTRVIKQDRDYSRPDKGERVKVKISLLVEKITLYNLDRLRISGRITESSNEAIPHGSHHSLTVQIGNHIVISKRYWSDTQRRLVKPVNKIEFVLVAIDSGECGIARLYGTHLEFLPNIYSGAGGKRYKTNYTTEKFFHNILQSILAIQRDKILVFGPGNTKNRLVNHMRTNTSLSIQMVEGIDSGGEDGIYTFTKSQAMREIISDSKLAKVSSIIDDIMISVHKKSKKFTMGYNDTVHANQLGAVESIVFSDHIIQQNEEGVIQLLNDCTTKGVETYGVDSTTDIGLRVTGLGGIVSTLRYAIN